MNPFTRAISKAYATLTCSAGVDVTYQRGDEWVRTRAVSGRTDFGVDEGFDVAHDYRSRDYIFRTCDLRLGGEPVQPQRGDEIRETVGGEVRVYDVLSPGGGEQVWRYCDHGGTALRVHTKLKQVVAL